MKRKLFSKYAGRFIILFASRMLGALALFAINLLIVEYLGVEALADYAVFISMVSLLSVCLFMGYSSVATIFAAEYNKTKQPELLKGFVMRALKIGVVILALVLLLIFSNNFFFPNFVDLETPFNLVMVVITASAIAMLGLNGAVQVGLKRQVAGSLPEILIRPVLLLLGTSVLLWFGLVSDISGLYAVTVTAAWVAFLVVLIFDKSLTQAFKGVHPKVDSKRWQKAALPWLGTTLLWDYMIDIIILLSSLLVGSAELALLHICFRYRVLAGFGMRTIHTLLMPEITEHFAEKDDVQMKFKIQQANLVSFGYSIGVLLVFAIMGNWLLNLFSFNAINGDLVLLIVTSTMLMRSIFGPAPLVLAVHNLHVVTMLVSFAGLVFASGWIWTFHETQGVLAVATGYTGANLLISFHLWLYAKRKTKIDTSIFAGWPRKRSTV